MLWPDLKKIIFDFTCMGIFPACMPVDYMPVWCSLSLERGHRIPLKLELKMVMSHHMGAGHQTWALWERS